MYGFSSYVPLWCKSNFSFLEGASHPEELVDEAHRLGLPAVALTDRDGLYGIVRAHIRAKRLGIKLIVGAEMSIVDGSSIVLLVKNRGGYVNLCKLISLGRLAYPKGQSKVTWRQVCLHAKGLVALWGGGESLLVTDDSEQVSKVGVPLKQAFGNDLFVFITRHKRPEETRQEICALTHAQSLGLPTVAGMETLYHSRARRPLQDILRCIQHKLSIEEGAQVTNPNDEHYLKSAASFCSLFSEMPHAVHQTLEIADGCVFSLDEINYRYPSTTRPDGTSSFDWLRTLTFKGAHDRYGEHIPGDVKQQIERELSLINELDYPGYFLTMYEIVMFCREHNILCQGRGSAANSAVCYCLGITAIDPVRMNLLFERFISRERAEPPDIDLDIEHNRREEVIQHVYEKYGRGHAAMVAVIIRYRPKSAVRDVGKVLGIPDTVLSRLSKLLSRYGDLPQEVLVQAGVNPGVPAHQQLLERCGEILDFPRHLSIHPGGFILGEEPINHLVPVENATMPERTVIQWDKDDVEALGLFKVDLLGLGALTHLHLCFDLLKNTDGIDLSLSSIPSDDTLTFEMISKGDTVGVFQIESRAQMSMLPRLKPRNFYDLVIEVSIVRPGPITGGMVHPYLRRRNNQEPVVYPHPCLKPVLEKTLGVPLFQEQVMKVAMLAADYTPGEADQLRRDMAAWKKSGRIERHKERLISRMTQKGIAEEFAERIFDQIRGFGEYGFPESHAASFALISYATAYLRCHYPAVFTCGLLNALPMGFYMPSTLVEDAKRNGVTVLPVDVCHSGWFCHITGQGALQMGIRHVKGVGFDDWKKIEIARAACPFAGVADVARRTRLNERVLGKLAEVGGFASFGGSRRKALWETKGHAQFRHDTLSLPESELTIPEFNDLCRFDAITWDYAGAGHSVHGHPLFPLRNQLEQMGVPDAATLSGFKDGRQARYAGMVICRQRPSTASGVVFMTLEDETGFVNVVCWKGVFERYAVLAKTTPFLGVIGKIQHQDGVTHLIAEELWKPKLNLRPVGAPSRDFK